MRDITIKPALNGFVVRLGCQRVVFNDRDTMFRALKDYLDEPGKIEEMYKYCSINSKQLGFERNSPLTKERISFAENADAVWGPCESSDDD